MSYHHQKIDAQQGSATAPSAAFRPALQEIADMLGGPSVWGPHRIAEWARQERGLEIPIEQIRGFLAGI